jgi:hypothetical protein
VQRLVCAKTSLIKLRASKGDLRSCAPAKACAYSFNNSLSQSDLALKAALTLHPTHLKDLVSDGCREHMAGDVPSGSGRGNTTTMRSTRDAISDTVASHAISDEQRARKKVLDNRQ